MYCNCRDKKCRNTPNHQWNVREREGGRERGREREGGGRERESEGVRERN